MHFPNAIENLGFSNSPPSRKDGSYEAEPRGITGLKNIKKQKKDWEKEKGKATESLVSKGIIEIINETNRFEREGIHNIEQWEYVRVKHLKVVRRSGKSDSLEFRKTMTGMEYRISRSINEHRRTVGVGNINGNLQNGDAFHHIINEVIAFYKTKGIIFTPTEIWFLKTLGDVEMYY